MTKIWLTIVKDLSLDHFCHKNEIKISRLNLSRIFLAVIITDDYNIMALKLTYPNKEFLEVPREIDHNVYNKLVSNKVVSTHDFNQWKRNLYNYYLAKQKERFITNLLYD